jgi:hypothetical protein
MLQWAELYFVVWESTFTPVLPVTCSRVCANRCYKYPTDRMTDLAIQVGYNLVRSLTLDQSE